VGAPVGTLVGSGVGSGGGDLGRGRLGVPARRPPRLEAGGCEGSSNRAGGGVGVDVDSTLGASAIELGTNSP